MNLLKQLFKRKCSDEGNTVKLPGMTVLVVRVKGADVKTLGDWAQTIQTQLQLRDHRVLVINDSAELKVSIIPAILSEAGIADEGAYYVPHKDGK